jgi:hypothetical protein
MGYSRLETEILTTLRQNQELRLSGFRRYLNDRYTWNQVFLTAYMLSREGWIHLNPVGSDFAVSLNEEADRTGLLPSPALRPDGPEGERCAEDEPHPIFL